MPTPHQAPAPLDPHACARGVRPRALRPLGVAAAFTLLAACPPAGSNPAPPASPAPPAAPALGVAPPAPDTAPPSLRLATGVRPTHYALDLTVIPTDDSFHGEVAIDLALAAPTRVLWLHGADLTLEATTLTAAGASVAVHPIARTPAIDDAELIGFVLDRPIGPGAARLAIRYRGKLPATESSGLYRQVERGEWYAFTQFEATSARHAFPCFDEPGFKVPLGLTLHVKRDHVAVANAPQIGESDDGAGMKTVRFADTRPLPTYLIALAVGPFDIVDGGTAGRNHTPLRVIVPRGRADEAAYAVAATPEILTRLEGYFDLPYPYEKLDQIAVPRKSGAMENAGLITYGAQRLLAARHEDTVARRRRFADLAAHELAHHWFGDLVTLTWWDDLWLNEAFASWMADVIIADWQPGWGVDGNAVRDRARAMRSDALASARRIREPIATKHDIAAAFDGITYDKGSAVIAMIEGWLGPDRFRAAIRSYLRQHAHATATTADFVAALSAAAGLDVAPVLGSFLDQVGTPDVDVELVCGEGQPPRLVLRQQRYTPIGSTASADHTWQIPMCVAFGGDRRAGRACTVLGQPRGELVLPTQQCPRWVLANDGARGYYHARYRGALQDRLLDAAGALSLAERVTTLDDLAARVAAGDLALDHALARLPGFARDPDRHLTRATLRLLDALDDHLVPRPLRPNRARFVRKLLGDRARALGWTPAASEPDDRALLRPELLRAAALAGEQPALIARAKRLAVAWLADRRAIDPAMVDTVLATAARFGDRALFDRLLAAARVEPERRIRTQLISAMSEFGDPEIAAAGLAVSLADSLEPRDSISLVYAASRNDATRDAAWAFVRQHLDALLARLPRDHGASFIDLGAGFCDPEHRAELASFFQDRAATYLNGPRSLAETLESIDLCIARKRAHEASAAAFLARW
jgi:cytosol alanyl aminopeptidase